MRRSLQRLHARVISECVHEIVRDMWNGKIVGKITRNAYICDCIELFLGSRSM